MSIVTKTGDQGTTSLMYQRRVPKTHPRIEACGCVDELNAALGLARAAEPAGLFQEELAWFQKDLIRLMGELATAPEDFPRYTKQGFARVSAAMTQRLEEQVVALEKETAPLQDWATPGANFKAAALDLARTICRRAERRVCAVKESGELGNTEIIPYLNRLSDLLWLMARRAEATKPPKAHKAKSKGPSRSALPAALILAVTGFARAENSPIRFSEIGAKVMTDYQGDALVVTATPDGAQLRCGFQQLEGHATSDGLWLESTLQGRADRFRSTATVFGRINSRAREWGLIESAASEPTGMTDVAGNTALAARGIVAVLDQLVRFTRPGLLEEYSVSVDGVRQDFVIAERPAGTGDLWVELDLRGARAEPAPYGARLMLEGSGRALAYSRLRATDAAGRQLEARLEVLSAGKLAIRVADGNATYPVRVDPTFSDANWVSMNPGMPGADSTVYALTLDANGNLYVGGNFTTIGTVVTGHVARWNGSTWSALGAGVDDSVYALAMSGNILYAGGHFSTAGGVAANYIAAWDGSAWSALGAGVDSDVYALALDGTVLYAGGDFTKAGGVTVNFIAAWNGGTWSALGTGLDSDVYALAVSGTLLYAGGHFTMAGATTANYIAAWNGSAWSALGTGMNNDVYALAVSGTVLYAGGTFTIAGGVTAGSVAAWNGSAWLALGGGMNREVDALAVSGTVLYAGGAFTNAAGVTANYIAAWNGSAWSALGLGMNDTIYALAVNGAVLYAGGDFIKAGGVTVNYIAAWNSSTWSALGTGVDSDVYALAVNGATLYAGGNFTRAGGTPANYIAAWNGSTWSALGSGMDNDVYALAVNGTVLYAGGHFTRAGGTPANYIAAWNGSAWSALGSGMDNDVYALAVNGTVLYAGGAFTNAAGVTANYIAAWNGSAWSPLGSGMDHEVDTLSVSGATLYAGGGFGDAGGVPANHVAAWNGSAWSPLGSGMDGDVYALAVNGPTLYAGGDFTTAGGGGANSIAAWNGSAWSALGSGMNSHVYALAATGSTLYAGGDFTTAGGVAANSIAAWNGSAWSGLGSGLNRQAAALAADGDGHLFVGGDFSLAGTNVSPFIAQANIPASVRGGRFAGLAYSRAGGFSCVFSNASIGQTYRIQTSLSLAPGSWTDLTNFTYTGPIAINDPSAVTAPRKFYRAVSP